MDAEDRMIDREIDRKREGIQVKPEAPLGKWDFLRSFLEGYATYVQNPDRLATAKLILKKMEEIESWNLDCTT